jgi:malate synthase
MNTTFAESSAAPASQRLLESLSPDIQLPRAACTPRAKEVLTPEVLALLRDLHHQFDGRRRELLRARQQRQARYDAGGLPGYEPPTSEAVQGDWTVAPVPADLRIRRVEITGPVNSTKMVINMLSRGADGERADTAMLDFEDSMKPSWGNVIEGVHNVIGAVQGTLEVQSGGKTYALSRDDMAVIMVRVRGLHLDESNLLVDGQPIAAGLFDLTLSFLHTAWDLLNSGRTPKYYVPKTEHYLEARWWNDVFCELQRAVGLPPGTLRATFLVETLPAAFQIEEILYEIREHAAGLNVGRWDKIFSDIKVLKNHADRVMADRGTINMHKPWMANYAQRLIKICHSRGAYAIGGMAAFTPGKSAELREQQVAKVSTDKMHEFALGHDGCWVSHPYFIGPALKQFKCSHQTERKLDAFDRYPDLLPRGEGPRTLAGLRTNVRVGIAYQQGWNDDIGCVAWDNLMEDLATLEISRAQTWQWLHHGITLEEGQKVTTDLVREIFREELARILAELPPESGSALREAFKRAAADAEEIFVQPQLTDFFRAASDPVDG